MKLCGSDNHHTAAKFSNHVIHRMGNAPNILCPRCNEQEESHPHFILYNKLFKTTLHFISDVMNLNYSFNITSKISLQATIMGASSQSHDGVPLKILPILLEVFVRHFSCCIRKAFHDDGYDKIN